MSSSITILFPSPVTAVSHPSASFVTLIQEEALKCNVVAWKNEKTCRWGLGFEFLKNVRRDFCHLFDGVVGGFNNIFGSGVLGETVDNHFG